jgi:hypothetical protein
MEKIQKINEVVRLGCVKSLELQDFVEEVAMANAKFVNYMDGFYTIHFGTTYQYNPQSNTLLFVVPAVFYSSAEYHKYLMISANDFRFEMRDKIGELKPNTILVKATKFEDFERDNIDNHILKSLKQLENKKSEQTSRGGTNE